jgi:hypothetical protein
VVVAHILSASLIALTFAGIAPGETPYLIAAFLSAGILDLDSVLDGFRKLTTGSRPGDHAGGPLHGLLGLFGAGALSGLLFLADGALARVVFVAFTTHLVQDWVTGKSLPLAPLDDTEIHFFAWTFRQRALWHVAIGTLFGALWILYLAGVL